MSLVLYISSVSSSQSIKKQQQRMRDVLSSKNYEFKEVDIAVPNSGHKEEMRKKIGDPTSLPPQLFNGDKYLGGYDAFDLAVEDEVLAQFLNV